MEARGHFRSNQYEGLEFFIHSDGDETSENVAERELELEGESSRVRERKKDKEIQREGKR